MIQCKGFLLRRWKNGDEEALRYAADNPRIAKNVTHLPNPYTLEDATQWVAKCQNQDPKNLRLAIDINNTAIGCISLENISPNHKAEIGYWIGEDYWGNGIMTKAVRALTEYGHEVLHLKRIHARVYDFNIGSQKVLENAGYSFEGRLRNEIFKNEQYIDAFMYSSIDIV